MAKSISQTPPLKSVTQKKKQKRHQSFSSSVGTPSPRPTVLGTEIEVRTIFVLRNLCESDAQFVAKGC